MITLLTHESLVSYSGKEVKNFIKKIFSIYIKLFTDKACTICQT